MAADLQTALKRLEEKVRDFVEDSCWREAVYAAFETVMEENDGNYGLKIAVENKNPQLMNPTFLNND